MDVTTFRQNFPEFADSARFTDTQAQFFLTIGETMLNADRWGALLDYGLGLFVAHHLAIASRDVAAADMGGVPGAVTGPTSSKSVDKVSVSYDTGAVSLNDAGFWNMSSYGIRFWNTVRMVGAGGIQL